MRHTLATMVARRVRYEIEGWGVGELWLGDGAVLAHELASPARGGSEAPLGGANPPERTLTEEASHAGADFVPNLVQRFRSHLAGDRSDYGDVPLDLSWCTPFQRALAQALRAVPWGEVVTYGELSAYAGRPRAARAAGTFCAENRFALLLPCHRVVAADGIGGYGPAGVGLKRRLLALEGVTL